MLVFMVDDGEAAAVDGYAGRDGELVSDSSGVDGEFAAGRAAVQAMDDA